jgi:putative ABC transport system permease protein
MAEEMRLHFEHLARENAANGLSLEEARFAALRQFGGADQIKEECRDGRGWRLIEHFFRDIRFGARALRKSPGFSLTAVLTLALCVGANTAIFSVIYALLLKPLPFPTPGRIVEIYNLFPKAGLPKEPCSIIQYQEYKNQTVSYDAVGMWSSNIVMLGAEGSADRITEAHCTPEMFDILGAKPVIGSFFTLENDRSGEDKVIVLTQSFWESHFAEDPTVCSKTMRVDGETYRIIGVAPRAIEAFDARAKFIKPLARSKDSVSQYSRFALNTQLYARLKVGHSPDSALSEATAVERRYYEVAPANMKAFLDNSGHEMAVVPIQAERTRLVTSSLVLIQGAAVFVLLVGCVNIANLLLARTNSRQHEVAIRSALGGSRGTIVLQFMTEYLLLIVLGIGIGVGIALGCLPFANHFVVKVLPNTLPVKLDAGALTIATGLFLMVGLVVGFLPALNILRTKLTGGIPVNARGSSGGPGVRMFSSLLVTGQIAAALVLLSGAGLLGRSFAKAISVDPGFDPANVLTANIAVPGAYRQEQRWTAFQERLIQAIREIPGVESAAAATSVPFLGVDNSNPFTIKDSKLPPGSPQPVAQFIGVSVDYFRTLHIQLLEGRFFDHSDVAAGRHAHVVDERFARKYFPWRSAVGGRFAYDRAPDQPPEKESDVPVIVGVVRWVPHNGVEDRSNNPFIYYPIASKVQGGLSLLVRSTRQPSDLVHALREKIRSVDVSIPLFDISTLQDAVDGSFENRKAILLVLGGFAALALFLSAIGIYGVLAYDVSLRTREIGIRGAIGASRPQIMDLIMRQAAWNIVAGSLVGLVCAVMLSRYIADLLYELSPTDPLAYVSVTLMLVAVALLASYLPARRAAGIDPILALRAE